jgi:hypothetical protein
MDNLNEKGQLSKEAQELNGNNEVPQTEPYPQPECPYEDGINHEGWKSLSSAQDWP